MAHVDYFLKIDGIKGESQDKGHKDEIHLSSYSMGVTQTGSMASDGGGGAGKASFHDLSCTASIGAHSALLFKATASGKHIKTIVLTARKAGEKPVDYFILTLTDSVISGYQLAGSQGDIIPSEQFTINFAKIEMSHATQKADGSLEAAHKAGHDLKQNVTT